MSVDPFQTMEKGKNPSSGEAVQRNKSASASHYHPYELVKSLSNEQSS